jgi:hypothetical protein
MPSSGFATFNILPPATIEVGGALVPHRPNVEQTFLSAGAGDFPVASVLPTPDSKVRLTGRLKSLPYQPPCIF